MRTRPGTRLGVQAIDGSTLLEIRMTVLPRIPALPHTRPPFDALTIAALEHVVLDSRFARHCVATQRDT